MVFQNKKFNNHIFQSTLSKIINDLPIYLHFCSNLWVKCVVFKSIAENKTLFQYAMIDYPVFSKSNLFINNLKIKDVCVCQLEKMKSTMRHHFVLKVVDREKHAFCGSFGMPLTNLFLKILFCWHLNGQIIYFRNTLSINRNRYILLLLFSLWSQSVIVLCSWYNQCTPVTQVWSNKLSIR